MSLHTFPVIRSLEKHYLSLHLAEKYLVDQQEAFVFKRLFLVLPSASGYFRPMPHAVSKLISLLVAQILSLAEENQWVPHAPFHLTLEDIVKNVPSAFPHQQSIPLFCTIGRAIIEFNPLGSLSTGYANRLFRALDTCVVDMCTRFPDNFDDSDKLNIQR